MSELGRLEEVDLRIAWQHEAHHFTPWLAEHLDQLASVIGIPLEHEDSEVAVENFAADILARNPEDNTRILIENQLECSDHCHLGQLMTYLAGLNASVVVWVAKVFQEPHLAAIQWLNDHTVEPYAFFAVRIKVVRIANSPMAPVFEVVERPNNWERRLAEATRRSDSVTSPHGQRREAFWEEYLERFPDEQAHGKATGSSSRWRDFDSIDPVIALYVGKDEVGVFIRGKRRVSTEDIEDELANALGVGSRENISNTGIYKKGRRGDPVSKLQRTELMNWLHEVADQYEATLKRVLVAAPKPTASPTDLSNNPTP